jgi:hypothetical protein
MFRQVLTMSSVDVERMDEKTFRRLAPMVEEHYKHHAVKGG